MPMKRRHCCCRHCCRPPAAARDDDDADERYVLGLVVLIPNPFCATVMSFPFGLDDLQPFESNNPPGIVLSLPLDERQRLWSGV